MSNSSTREIYESLVSHAVVHQHIPTTRVKNQYVLHTKTIHYNGSEILEVQNYRKLRFPTVIKMLLIGSILLLNLFKIVILIQKQMLDSYCTNLVIEWSVTIKGYVIVNAR